MKRYISPEIRIIKIDTNDIISTSINVNPYDTNSRNLAPGRSIWDDDYDGYIY